MRFVNYTKIATNLEYIYIDLAIYNSVHEIQIKLQIS
jgi:hypothetical protein